MPQVEDAGCETWYRRDYFAYTSRGDFHFPSGASQRYKSPHESLDIATVLVIDWKWISGFASSLELCEWLRQRQQFNSFCVSDKKWNFALGEEKKFRDDVHRMCSFLAARKFLVKLFKRIKTHVVHLEKKGFWA